MNIEDKRQDLDKSINFLKSDIASLRTGRATTAIVEDLTVESYGTKQSLKAVGTIAVPDPKTVTITPWDKSQLQNIENSVRDSSLGINPVNNGTQIILSMPELTSERRSELIKVLHSKLENTRISIRKIREEAREKIEKAEDNKEINEDEKYKLQEDLDKIVKEYNDKIKQIGEEKEKEINTV